MKRVTTIIPIFRNADMVIRNLRINLPLLKGTEVILIDDASLDGTAEKIAQEFPGLTIIENTKNMGFGRTVNKAITKASGEFLFLLNSDVVLKDTSFTKTLADFDNNPNLFAVCAMQKERDGKNIGRNSIYYKEGLIYHKRMGTLRKGINGWADGGSSVFRRTMVSKLGNFNELLSPFYFEDIELSYRAHKMGWDILFDPSFYVEHHHESTIGKYYTKEQITRIALKNQILASMCLFTDPRIVLKELFWFKIHFWKAVFRLDWISAKAYGEAFLAIPAVIRYHFMYSGDYRKTDDQILSSFL